ncbi:MAG TPA: M23 family metallopeptidase [Bryobacteraceae bacterium]|nr:M23 family metallopeptidase [Bryobacteraceae bacterium]
MNGLRADQIQDTFHSTRGGGTREHRATDILAPRGTPVLAVADGTIAKLFLSVPGGNTIYEFDPSGTWCFYYAHLDGYAPGLHEGMAVRHGDTIGFVGTTGNAGNTPHLHLEFSRLGPEKHWWQSTPVDPYPILMALAAGARS